nr:putative integron gene cassette protein [uncultured bacterium]
MVYRSPRDFAPLTISPRSNRATDAAGRPPSWVDEDLWTECTETTLELTEYNPVYVWPSISMEISISFTGFLI